MCHSSTGDHLTFKICLNYRIKKASVQRELYLRYMKALEREIVSNSAKDRVKFPMAIVLDANDNTAEL